MKQSPVQCGYNTPSSELSSHKSKKTSGKDTLSNALIYVSIGITVLIVVLGLAEQIVGYVSFIQSNGYANQLDLVQDSSGEGAFKAFTSPGQKSSVEITLSNIAFVFMVVQIFTIAICRFINGGAAGKIVTVIVTIPTLIVVTLAIIELTGSFETLGITRESTFYQFLLDNGQVIIRGGLFFALAMVVVSFTNEDARLLIIAFLIGLAVYFIGIPLVFWVIKNAIPIVSVAVIIGLCVIVIVVLAVVSKYMPSGGGANSGTNDTASNGSSSKAPSKQLSQRERTFGLGNPNFRRTKGDSGGMEVEGIFCTGAQGQEVYVCSVRDYEDGKVAIINNGKRVISIAGCKSPKQ